MIFKVRGVKKVMLFFKQKLNYSNMSQSATTPNCKLFWRPLFTDSSYMCQTCSHLLRKGFSLLSLTEGAQTFDFMNGQILPKQCGGQHCVDILLIIIHNQRCVPIGNLTLLLNSVASSRLGTVTIIQPGFATFSLRIFQVLKNKVNGFL